MCLYRRRSSPSQQRLLILLGIRDFRLDSFLRSVAWQDTLLHVRMLLHLLDLFDTVDCK
jgi:hypothetical protein